MRAQLPKPAGPRLWLLPATAVVLAAVWLLPEQLYPAAWYVGYAVCHQLPGHSYFAGPWQLPLCARCTGQYLGAFSALVYLLWRGRGRAARWPDARVAAFLALGLLAWLVDGLNSFAAFWGLPHLYTPQQPLRLATGLVAGVGWMTLFWPLWVQAMVATPKNQRLWRLEDIPGLLAAVGLPGMFVHFGPAPVRLAMGMLSAFSAWLFLTMVVGAGVRLLVGFRLPRPLAIGAAGMGSLAIIAGMGFLRTALAAGVM